MQLSFTGLLILILASSAQAQLQLLPDDSPQVVFGGGQRTVELCWHNAGGMATNAETHAQIFQASSATVAPVSEVSWKRLQVLPQQTVLESAALDFPAVNGPTEFIVRWLDGTNQLPGLTKVMVFPTNLLSELRLLLNGKALGVLDPDNAVKPALKAADIAFIDLEEMPLAGFRGQLAVICPHASLGEEPVRALLKMSAVGTAVVWVQPPAEVSPGLTPSFYMVPGGKADMVIAQPELIAQLSVRPHSQLNLVALCRRALHPEPFAIPNFAHQP